MALKLYINYFGSREPFDWNGDLSDFREAYFNMMKRFYEIVCQRIFDKGGFIDSRQGDQFEIGNTKVTSFEGIEYFTVDIWTPRDGYFNSSDYNFYFKSSEFGSLCKNGSRVFEVEFYGGLGLWDLLTFPAPSYLEKDAFRFDVPDEEFPKQKSDWYKLYLKDKKICEDYSMREIHFEDIDTKEISKIAIIGGGITATGFSGNLGVDYLFREGTNAYKTETFGVISGGGTLSSPFRYFSSTYQRFAPNWPLVVVENTAKVNEAKNTANSVWGSLKATGVYMMATGKESILKALNFTYAAPAWLLRGTAFLNISTKLGVGSTIDNKWKVIASKDILSSGADEQSKYWDEVNKAIREGRTSHFYDLGNNGGSATAIDTTTTQATDSFDTQMQDVNDSLQKIASSISANTTVQTAIQSAINNLTDTNKNGLQGIQNNLTQGTGTGQTITIDPNYKMPIDISQLEYLINTTSGIPIATQPLAQLLIDGLAINMDSVKNGINLNAPKIDDITLKLDSIVGTQIKEMSDNIKINKEKEGRLLDNKIANIPMQNEILSNEHEAITQNVDKLNYAQRQAKIFTDLHSPSTYKNEDGVTLEKGYYSNPSLSQAREYNDSIISHGKIEGAKSFKGKMDILKNELSFLDDNRIKARFEDINPGQRFDVNSLISKIKL